MPSTLPKKTFSISLFKKVKYVISWISKQKFWSQFTFLREIKRRTCHPNWIFPSPKDKDVQRTSSKSTPRDLSPLRHSIRMTRKQYIYRQWQWQWQWQRQLENTLKQRAIPEICSRFVKQSPRPLKTYHLLLQTVSTICNLTFFTIETKSTSKRTLE